MRIAVCLAGRIPFDHIKTKTWWEHYIYTESFNLKLEDRYMIDGKSFLSLKSWEKNFIEQNNVDFFIHDWSEDSKYRETVENIFKPKSLILENLIENDAHLSLSLSQKRCFELLEKYQGENNFIYDLVILTRMDLVWMYPIKIDGLFDPNKFTIGNWNSHMNEIPLKNNIHSERPYENGKNGILDLVFVSNFENMKLYTSTLNEKISTYRSNNNIGWAHTVCLVHINEMKLDKILEYKLYQGIDYHIQHKLTNQNPYYLNMLKDMIME